jgi:hypothetical protein
MTEGETMTEWQTVGEVGVDSGQVMITDPCYVDTEWSQGGDAGTYSYDGITAASAMSTSVQLHYRKGHAGAGVAVSGFGGDGAYPVQVTYTDDGHVAAVRVVFILDAVTD